MPAHARNPSTAASDGGSESSLTDFSSSEPQPSALSHAPAPPAQSTQGRDPSIVARKRSDSTLSTLSSSDSEPLQGRAPRPQTPNTRNAQDVPGLTFSPSSVASSPESIKSYGLSALEEFSALENVVKGLLDSRAEAHTAEGLYATAQQHLKIFDNPLYSSLDTPEWVRRVCGPQSRESYMPVFGQFTVRRLFKAMYDTAEDLHLDGGKRYVVAAICACAIQANKCKEKEHEFAKRAQGLASTWAAFLLWPFFTQKRNTILSVNEISVNATPTREETAAMMDEGLNQYREATLREKVIKRDGHRCVLSGTLDSQIFHALMPSVEGAGEDEEVVLDGQVVDRAEPLEVAHIFKRSVVVYNSNSNSEKGREKFKSATATFEVLKHYCQLDQKYLDDPDLMDKPENAILLNKFYHSAFDEFLWCLKPTETPNRYKVKEYKRALTHMKDFSQSTDRYVTFTDHTADDINKLVLAVDEAAPSKPRRGPKRPHKEISVELPDPELLRLHAALMGVLRMSGAAHIFDLIIERQGPGNGPAVPSADGIEFMKEVVDTTVQELRDSVAELGLRTTIAQ